MLQKVVAEKPCAKCGAEMVLFAKIQNGTVINWWSCAEKGTIFNHVAEYVKETK